MKITYLKGDATNPQGDGNIIIPHICNNVGGWGRGFVLAISKRWKEPEKNYRSIEKENLVLGSVRFIPVESNITIANMIAQKGISSINNPKPIQYDALKKCLIEVNRMANLSNSTIHAPKFGNGLAGGDWNIIEKIINETINVDVYIYEF